MKTVRFIVRGRVQGVFFRASTREQAVALGLTGHARNLIDGSVEVVAHGDAMAIDQLEVWLRHGPPTATVEELYREDIEAHEPLTTFVVR